MSLTNSRAIGSVSAPTFFTAMPFAAVATTAGGQLLLILAKLRLTSIDSRSA
jgi:hypothetical protein